jgi:RNA polymerase sigma-70 factor (ECF subfamily)
MQNSPKLNIIAVRNGDRSAFEAIYHEYADMLYHLCLQYINEPSVAEEIVQDAFVKLWEVKESLKEELGVRNYLYTITKNNCLLHIRKEQIVMKNSRDLCYLEMQFNYEAMSSLADSIVEFDELKDRIDSAIDALPENLKEVFLLSRFEELKYKEIAEQLDVSVKTVEARMSKALVILRKDLKEYLPIISLITSVIG